MKKKQSGKWNKWASQEELSIAVCRRRHLQLHPWWLHRSQVSLSICILTEEMRVSKGKQDVNKHWWDLSIPCSPHLRRRNLPAWDWYIYCLATNKLVHWFALPTYEFIMNRSNSLAMLNIPKSSFLLWCNMHLKGHSTVSPRRFHNSSGGQKGFLLSHASVGDRAENNWGSREQKSLCSEIHSLLSHGKYQDAAY